MSLEVDAREVEAAVGLARAGLVDRELIAEVVVCARSRASTCW